MIKQYEAVIRSQNRQWDRASKKRDALQNKQESEIANIRGCLRRASAPDYADWLRGFLEWGVVTDYYDQDLAPGIITTDHFYVATHDFKLPSGLVSNALNIIVPENINVEIPDDYGHCTIYKMPSDLLGYGLVPMYRDVARLCDG